LLRVVSIVNVNVIKSHKFPQVVEHLI